jgi:8-hydroxy-5-deazaflavin:NADPH oxidoreductase
MSRSMRVGIVGAGNVGRVLAQRLVEVGHDVKIANSRGRETLRDIERKTGALACDISQVGRGVDVLIIAIPEGKVSELPSALTLSLPADAIVVDTGNYYPQRDGIIREIGDGVPESAWVSSRLGVPVVKAFNNILAESLLKDGRPNGASNRIALPVAADDEKATNVIMEMIGDLGFDSLNAGPIAQSWRQQPGQPAYCTNATSAELPILLDRADLKKAPQRRDQAMKIADKIPATFPVRYLVSVARVSVGLDLFKPRSWLAVLLFAIAIVRR